MCHDKAVLFLWVRTPGFDRKIRKQLIMRETRIQNWHYSALIEALGEADGVEEFLLFRGKGRQTGSGLALMQRDLMKLNAPHDFQRPLRG